MQPRGIKAKLSEHKIHAKLGAYTLLPRVVSVDHLRFFSPFSRWCVRAYSATQHGASKQPGSYSFLSPSVQTAGQGRMKVLCNSMWRLYRVIGKVDGFDDECEHFFFNHKYPDSVST